MKCFFGSLFGVLVAAAMLAGAYRAWCPHHNHVACPCSKCCCVECKCPDCKCKVAAKECCPGGICPVK